MLTILVARTSDQSVMNRWIKSHAEITQDQPEVKLLRNALLSPNLVPVCSALLAGVIGHVKRLAGVNQRSNCLEMSYGYQIW